MSSENYRFGFNGKEKDPSVSSLTHYDYGFRIYNPGIGRFLSVDPLTASYPWYTPYQFAGNMPIAAVDLDGLEEWNFMDMLKDYLLGNSVLGKVSGRSDEEILENVRKLHASVDAVNKVAEAYEKVYGTILPGYSAGIEATKGNYKTAVFLLVLDAGSMGKGKVAKKVVEDAAEQAVKKLTGSSERVGLDANALIIGLEKGGLEALDNAIAGRVPTISITAAKEFLALGDIQVLRNFLTERSGGIAKAADPKIIEQLKEQAALLGRIVGDKDAAVAGSAIKENATLITRDSRLFKFLNAVGIPVEIF